MSTCQMGSINELRAQRNWKPPKRRRHGGWSRKKSMQKTCMKWELCEGNCSGAMRRVMLSEGIKRMLERSAARRDGLGKRRFFEDLDSRSTRLLHSSPSSGWCVRRAAHTISVFVHLQSESTGYNPSFMGFNLYLCVQTFWRHRER